jgi:hypothetical protein
MKMQSQLQQLLLLNDRRSFGRLVVLGRVGSECTMQRSLRGGLLLSLAVRPLLPLPPYRELVVKVYSVYLVREREREVRVRVRVRVRVGRRLLIRFVSPPSVVPVLLRVSLPLLMRTRGRDMWSCKGEGEIR